MRRNWANSQGYAGYGRMIWYDIMYGVVDRQE